MTIGRRGTPPRRTITNPVERAQWISTFDLMADVLAQLSVLSGEDVHRSRGCAAGRAR